MVMYPMSTTAFAISIMTVVMNPEVIPAFATEVIMTPSIIPIIAVIIDAVTVSSVPIESIIMEILTPTVTIIYMSTSTASVGPGRTTGGSKMVTPANTVVP